MNYSIKLTITAFLCLMISNTFSEDTYNLRLATSWGENFPVFSDSPKRVAQMVNSMSNGRLTIELVSADEHGQPLNIIEMVKSAEYDMGHSASYYWKDNYPNTLYFSTMPFGMLPIEQYSWFYFGGGQELMDEVYHSLGLISVPGGNTGAQMGGWFQKRIKDVSSFNGLRMRIPGFAGEVLAELGAIPINVPATELLEAMSSGKIQAVEYVGPALDFDLNLHLSAQFYYTGWHEPATETQFLINEKSIAKLPDDLKAILYAAMRTSAYDTYIDATHLSAKKWYEMRTEFPVIRVKDFPDSVIDALKIANSKKLVEFSNSDPLAKRIIQSQLSYQTTIREWTMLSDFSYLESIGK